MDRNIGIPLTFSLVFITLTEAFHSKQEYSTGRLLHLAHKIVLSVGNLKIAPLSLIFSSQKERKRKRRKEREKKKEKGGVFARQESIKVNISMKTKQVETNQAREGAEE